MTVGMFLAALAFVAAALVQIELDVSVAHIKTCTGQLQHALTYEAQFTHTMLSPLQKTLPTFPSGSESQAKFINMLSGTLDVKADSNQFTLQPYSVLQSQTLTVQMHSN